MLLKLVKSLASGKSVASGDVKPECYTDPDCPTCYVNCVDKCVFWTTCM
ncbi:hypothetical protein ACFO25_02470 [Paenactinomyces guangxiensis]|uniref:Uncharacterized protein n=1 Tax=Paenactinomyces guangxiensis TaxID=1490290 RepID=A0A7W1WV95_9BACL|nr:hypothetical protein [Paenactinomyces guangxiensis]MBA4496466.1 hypothetical protein [Paenactinomyces guangxiensis]MBH8593582.1 hypothetical protein [Paenactinomyces guangxiensis]